MERQGGRIEQELLLLLLKQHLQAGVAKPAHAAPPPSPSHPQLMDPSDSAQPANSPRQPTQQTHLLLRCCSTSFSSRTTSRSQRKPPLSQSPRRPLYRGLARLSLPRPVWLPKFRLQLTSCRSAARAGPCLVLDNWLERCAALLQPPSCCCVCLLRCVYVRHAVQLSQRCAHQPSPTLAPTCRSPRSEASSSSSSFRAATCAQVGQCKPWSCLKGLKQAELVLNLKHHHPGQATGTAHCHGPSPPSQRPCRRHPTLKSSWEPVASTSAATCSGPQRSCKPPPPRC